MIGSCRTCKHAYWKYRRPWETPGYCSQLCYDCRPPRSNDDPTAKSVAFLIRVHRLFVHQDDSTLTEYDCRRCEELEEQLAAMHHLEVIFTPAAEQARAASGTGGRA